MPNGHSYALTVFFRRARSLGVGKAVFRLRTLSCGFAVAALMTTACPAFAESLEWPTIELPEDAVLIDMGSEMLNNGVPMRLKGFVSSQTVEQSAVWFRRNFGQCVEDRVGPALVIGRQQGEFYLTVQLESTLARLDNPAGTRGLIAVSHLQGAEEQSDRVQADTERWLDRLPSGTRMLSQNSSQDGPQHSHYMVFVNGHSEQINRERLTEVLAQQGLVLEHTGQTADSPDRPHNPLKPKASGQTLYFSGGPNKEAMAIIARTPDGQVSTVLNILTPNGDAR